MAAARTSGAQDEAPRDAGLTSDSTAAAPVAAEPSREPPRALDGPPAAYPESAMATRARARVVLRLEIDANGRVTRNEVATSGGADFDAAAQAAALTLRFEPAKLNGAP